MTIINIDTIEIKVIRKKIKNIHLTIHPPEGQVRLSVPISMDDQAVRLFLSSKLSWIKNHQNRLANQDRPINQDFITGEDHLFFGQSYLLTVFENSRKQGIVLSDPKNMNLYVKPGHTRDKRQKILIEWYRVELKKRIPAIIKKWERIIGVKVEDWGVKRMKTRWGTCNINGKRIWINLELVKKDPRCLDFIIVHEMVHLLEQNHNERFKAYMSQFLPNWQSIQKELNRI